MNRTLYLPLLLSLTACSDVSISVAPELEGDDPGECSDAADNDGNGLFDCNDDGCLNAPECEPNNPPGQPELRIAPEEPRTTDTLRCVIDIASFDPDGDTVEYDFTWTVDGVDQGIIGASVDPAMTQKDQTWMCSVIPTDANGAVGPAASAAETVLNSAPEAPSVVVSPSEPIITDVLECIIDDPSFDADGDEVTYTYAWLNNGVPVGTGVPTLDWTLTAMSDTISCIVSPWDGFEDGPVGEGWVNVHADAKLWVSAGKNHTCSNQFDLSYACWGDNTYGQINQGPSVNYYQLEVGSDFTCGIIQNTGALDCWGNQDGNQHLTPLGSYIDLSLGGTNACAIASTGEIEAWGGAILWSDPAPTDEVMTAVSAGENYCCALAQSGDIACWGDDKPVTDIIGPFDRFDSGSNFVCALRENTINCYGDDTHGQQTDIPDGQWETISAGWKHACAIEVGTGFVTCWGDNTYGQLAAPSGQFTQVSSGWYHSCGKRPNDVVECWGCLGNDSGQCASPI